MGGPGTSGDAFRAVADPTRRAIIDLLSNSDCSVVELARPFRISRPAVSQHLRVLRDAGLVEVGRVGRERRYRLNVGPLQVICDWASQHKQSVDPAGRGSG